jgi:hypothetical protein
MWHVQGENRNAVHAQVWWENLKEKDHLEELGVDRRIIFN